MKQTKRTSIWFYFYKKENFNIFAHQIALTNTVVKLKKQIFILLLLIAGQINAQVADSIRIDTISLSSDSVLISFLTDEGVNVSCNNKVKLLTSGKEKFDDLFAVIRNAKHHIHLEYFNFRNDSIANALFDLLALKAKEGVKVRALFDAFGNWSNSRPLKRKHLERIRKRGIEIYHFDPLKFPYLNHIMHRDHRKIAIVDGKIAYTGGMNIADYYIKGLPKIGAWRDTHIRLEGSSVKDLQEIFLSIWNETTHQDIGGEEYFPQPDDSLGGNKVVAIVDRAPRKLPKLMRRTYAEAIHAARQDIEIVNPYFLPTRSIKKALKAALKRGVKVEIMLSAKADIGFTPEGSQYILHRLMKCGANVYLYKGAFHHSKIMMVDSLFCTIGTTNLDSRSLRYDYEVNAFLFDKQITNRLNEIFEKDKTNCTELTPAEWKKRSVWKKFSGWFAHLFTPVL